MKTVLDKFCEDSRKEGIELEQKRIALELLKYGMCEDDIVMYTKVSLEKLRSWEQSSGYRDQ